MALSPRASLARGTRRAQSCELAGTLAQLAPAQQDSHLPTLPSAGQTPDPRPGPRAVLGAQRAEQTDAAGLGLSAGFAHFCLGVASWCVFKSISCAALTERCVCEGYSLWASSAKAKVGQTKMDYQSELWISCFLPA